MAFISELSIGTPLSGKVYLQKTLYVTSTFAHMTLKRWNAYSEVLMILRVLIHSRTILNVKGRPDFFMDSQSSMHEFIQ